jgi:hypothetical protein
MEIDDPKREKLLSDRVEPMLTKSKTERVLPNLPNERSDKLEPMCILSATETAEPNRATPSTDKELPIRLKLRRLRLLAELMKSRIDILFPILKLDRTDKEDPMVE